MNLLATLPFCLPVTNSSFQVRVFSLTPSCFDSRQGRDFSFPHRVQTGSGTQLACYPVRARALSPRVKQTGRETEHSPASSVEVDSAWSYTSTPPYVFMAWCLSLPCVRVPSFCILPLGRGTTFPAHV